MELFIYLQMQFIYFNILECILRLEPFFTTVGSGLYTENFRINLYASPIRRKHAAI